MQRSAPGLVEDRRLADAIDALERRLQARSQYVTVDFGSTPTTTAQLEVGGLSWLTRNHVVSVCPTTSSQLAADLRGGAIAITPGKGLTLLLRTTSNLTGQQRVGLILV